MTLPLGFEAADRVLDVTWLPLHILTDPCKLIYTSSISYVFVTYFFIVLLGSMTNNWMATNRMAIVVLVALVAKVQALVTVSRLLENEPPCP